MIEEADEFLPDVDLESGDQELYEHHRWVADRGQELLRIDKFLMNRIQHASRNRIQNAAKAGNILVNGKEVKQNYRVKPGDEISLVLPHPPRDRTIAPENIPLEILFEDDEVLVINKQAGLVVHPGVGNYTGTLVNALMYHFSTLPDMGSEHGPRPGLVHRLDKDTSGVMVIAKTEFAMSHLARQFFQRTSDRRYTALVWGDLPNDHGTITGNIGRSLRDRKVMDVFPPDNDHSKHAVTHYTVLERFGYVTLVECKLETGRTHQIRVHFKHIGHPLFNDPWYGGNAIVKGTTFTKYRQFVENCFDLLPRQALHARTLAFTHPTSGAWMSFESPLPNDMLSVIARWRTYVAARPLGVNNDE